MSWGYFVKKNKMPKNVKVKKTKISKMATITFDLSDFDAKYDFKEMLQASDMKLALWKIADEVFKPHRRHGYPENPNINEYLNSDVEAINECSRTIIGELESKFYEILKDLKISLED